MKIKIMSPMLKVVLAAILFGAGAPISKLLLGDIVPTLMAAFLYLGSGLGLFLLKYIQKLRDGHNDEAGLSKNDWPWLICAVLVGGIAAPIVLMFSLKNTPASTASLLLNFESVATALIAGVVFREAIGKRIWFAVCLITLASILLSWDFSGRWGLSLGAVGVLCACILWGIDNNCTRNISAKDPLVIVMVKGLSAGAFSFILSMGLGLSLPALKFVCMAMILGLFSYGLSIALFVQALRELGSARTSALFGIAPFAGALLSLILFRESQGSLFFASLSLMAVGAVLLLNEEHDHVHVHEAIEHEHRHYHDDLHHTHCHFGAQIPQSGYHSHVHRHELMIHKHQHAPDIHHRHDHQ